MRSLMLRLVLGLALWVPRAAAQEVAPDSAVRAGRTSWLGRPAVGAQVGYSRSNLALAGGDLLSSRQGALTGAFLHFPLGSVLAIRPELLFSLKGGRIAAPVDQAEFDIELAYLELPLLARAVLPTGNVRPTLFGGPALALRIGCDFRLTTPTDTVRATCGRDNLSTVRPWDFGVVGGAGAEFRLRRATMAVEARYTLGARSVLDDVDLKNRAFSLTLGLTF